MSGGRAVRRTAGFTLVAAAAVWGSVAVCVGVPCVPLGVRHGLWLDRCPATDLRLRVEASASGLLRGQEGGYVTVEPIAEWLDGDGHAARVRREALRRGVVTTWSLERDGVAVEGLEVGPVRGAGAGIPMKLPTVPDGDYRLVARVDAGFEQREVQLPLALYAPALVHVASDRPLYKPGQTVHLRAAVLRRTDLGPIDDRPGRWEVFAPDGTEVLRERSTGGPWGVSATSLPLLNDATAGDWRARYVSGDDADEITFEVRPFSLPRTSLEASGSQRWFTYGDRLVVEGAFRYASGAPVANAAVDVTLRVAEGDWPIPLDWEAPRESRTGLDGRYSVDFGRVPFDLDRRSVLRASVAAVTETQEVARTAARLVLSSDSVAIDAVTELPGGLVQGFNNRSYVRVRTPDGRPLANHTVKLSRPYDPTATPWEATTDADGVAAMQIDPGSPVTVVFPAPPYRPRPFEPQPASVGRATRLADGQSLDMAERRSLDAARPAVEACGSLAVGRRDAEVALRVAPSGVVTEAMASEDLFGACLARAMRAVRWPPGEARTYVVAWEVPDALLPSFLVSNQVATGVEPLGLQEAVNNAALLARACVQRGVGQSGAKAAELHWVARAGAPRLDVDVVTGGQTGLSPAMLACVRGALSAVSLGRAPISDAMGVSVLTLNVPTPPGAAKPRARTETAYELAAEVRTASGEPVGTARWVSPVGAIPPLRVRASPPLVAPGESVRVELFRGPDYRGEPPTRLSLTQGTTTLGEAERVDGAYVFTVPESARGFAEVRVGDARAVVFIRDPAPLSVSLGTDREVYRPGELAQLTIRTTAGDRGSPAAVLLAGVDQTLSQLAPLLGPDDFGRVTVRVSSGVPAFDSFDARALALGQVRGENAALASLLRVGALPADPSGDRGVAASATVTPAVDEALAEAFYAVYAATVAKVRAWEREAPREATLTPNQLVGWWDSARQELAAAGRAPVDGYGRPLTLDRLPDELLALVDPRAIVADGSRLPEDVISWSRFVRSGGR